MGEPSPSREDGNLWQLAQQIQGQMDRLRAELRDEQYKSTQQLSQTIAQGRTEDRARMQEIKTEITSALEKGLSAQAQALEKMQGQNVQSAREDRDRLVKILDERDKVQAQREAERDKVQAQREAERDKVLAERYADFAPMRQAWWQGKGAWWAVVIIAGALVTLLGVIFKLLDLYLKKGP